MSVSPRNLILLIVDAFGGAVQGKTLLQKRSFFLGEILGVDLGFRPHYYGPYSDQVANEVTVLKNSGYLDEARLSWGAYSNAGFEVARSDFKITEPGKKVIAWFKRQYPHDTSRVAEAARRFKQAGDLDYVDLSIAAKAFWILREAKKPLELEQIAAEANKFAWTVKDKQVEKAAEFLKKLDLIED